MTKVLVTRKWRQHFAADHTTEEVTMCGLDASVMASAGRFKDPVAFVVTNTTHFVCWKCVFKWKGAK